MLQVGLTGGIGSGKSTIAKIFEQLSVSVYYADEAGKWVINNKAEVKKALQSLFSKAIYQNGLLNTSLVADMVFNDKILLQKMNDIVHPAVAIHYNNWLNEQQNQPYVMKEAAILFESGSYRAMDKVIAISAPEDLRITRVINRDAIDREGIKKRMNNQWSEEMRLEKADFVIYNDGNQAVIPQVMKIHQALINMKSHENT